MTIGSMKTVKTFLLAFPALNSTALIKKSRFFFYIQNPSHFLHPSFGKPCTERSWSSSRSVRKRNILNILFDWVWIWVFQFFVSLLCYLPQEVRKKNVFTVFYSSDRHNKRIPMNVYWLGMNLSVSVFCSL